MTTRAIIYRVEGDDGPPITVQHAGLIATGLTITARFTKPNGVVYERTATVDVDGDGADIPAEYHFDFVSGDLAPAGDQTFDIHLSGAAIADYSYPSKSPMILRVRCNG